MSQLIKRSFNYVPTTIDEALSYAKIIAESSFCPKDYKGKPGDVLVACQMGAEVGLSPLQSLQNIAVINGRPSIWGDAMLAIVLIHPDFEKIKEWKEGDTAYCMVKRKDMQEKTVPFSVNDAKKAGLWTKPGPWQQYPDRMLQLRARGFALRDLFADALKGLIPAEEAQDMPVMNANVQRIQPAKTILDTQSLKERFNAKPQNEEESIAIEQINVEEKPEEEQGTVTNGVTFDIVKSMMERSNNKNTLALAADLARSLSPDEKESLKKIYQQKNAQFSKDVA